MQAASWPRVFKRLLSRAPQRSVPNGSVPHFASTVHCKVHCNSSRLTWHMCALLRAPLKRPQQGGFALHITGSRRRVPWRCSSAIRTTNAVRGIVPLDGAIVAVAAWRLWSPRDNRCVRKPYDTVCVALSFQKNLCVGMAQTASTGQVLQFIGCALRLCATQCRQWHSMFRTLVNRPRGPLLIRPAHGLGTLHAARRHQSESSTMCTGYGVPHAALLCARCSICTIMQAALCNRGVLLSPSARKCTRHWQLAEQAPAQPCIAREEQQRAASLSVRTSSISVVV